MLVENLSLLKHRNSHIHSKKAYAQKREVFHMLIH